MGKAIVLLYSGCHTRISSIDSMRKVMINPFIVAVAILPSFSSQRIDRVLKVNQNPSSFSFPTTQMPEAFVTVKNSTAPQIEGFQNV